MSQPAGPDLDAGSSPVPVYPHWLIWRTGNPHSGLAALRDHLASRPPAPRDAAVWAPGWA